MLIATHGKAKNQKNTEQDAKKLSQSRAKKEYKHSQANIETIGAYSPLL